MRTGYNDTIFQLASLIVALVSLWHPLNVLSLLLASAGLISTLVDSGLLKGGSTMKKTSLVSLGICGMETTQGLELNRPGKARSMCKINPMRFDSSPSHHAAADFRCLLFYK